MVKAERTGWRSGASTTSGAIRLRRLFESVVYSARFLRVSMSVAASLVAGFCGQLAGCRWALWLGWGRGFSSSAAGFRQFVKFFEVY